MQLVHFEYSFNLIIKYVLNFHFFLKSVLCLAIGATMAVDYCKNMKCEKKPHVACNSPAANGVSFFFKF